MAQEIWAQTDGQVDGFVQSVGTAASLRGVGEALRELNEQVQLVAVEPAESAVLSGGPSGAHKIDGVGAGFVVPLWRDDVADEIDPVSTEEAVAMAIRLGPEATLVTVMCDTGMKYLSDASFKSHARFLNAS